MRNALLLLGAAFAGCAAGPHWSTLPAPTPAVREVGGERDLSTVAGFAGRYWSPRGMGSQLLEVGRDGTCRGRSYGCLAADDTAPARARVHDGRLHVEYPANRWHAARTVEYEALFDAGDLVLVPRALLPDLINHLHGDSEYLSMSFWWAESARDTPLWIREPPGADALPTEWQRCVRREPLRATVVRAGTDGRWLVDRGAADGVFPGMLLKAKAYRGPYSPKAFVVEVRDRECEIKPRNPGVYAVDTVVESGALRPR